MDSFSNASQRDLVCDEEMDDEPEFLTRSNAFVGGKRPVREWNQYAPQGSMSDEEVLEQPDLAEYFSQWVIPDKQVILLCRSYASYLAAKGHATSK